MNLDYHRLSHRIMPNLCLFATPALSYGNVIFTSFVDFTAIANILTIFHHFDIFIRGKDYVEMDINVHKFSSLPKQALATMFDRFDRMLISIGFCIESIEDEEMPETLLGTVTLLKPTHPMTPLFQPNASSTSLPATQESERA